MIYLVLSILVFLLTGHLIAWWLFWDYNKNYTFVFFITPLFNVDWS
jgi:hypothetical protein